MVKKIILIVFSLLFLSGCVKGDVNIKYIVIKETGPDHDKTFTVKVEVEGKELAIGEGRTKKHAEMDAAGKALEKLK